MTHHLPLLKISTLLTMSVLMLNCASDPSEATTKDPLAKLSPSARERMEDKKEQQLQDAAMAQVTEENLLSPYRYVTSTSRYSVFADILKASTHSKAVHAQGVTLLAPTNEAFEAMSNWKMLMRKGGQAEIDEFIAHHVIPGSMTYDQFKSESGHVCLSGESMTIDTRGGITFNGAHVRSGHVMTQNGSVIGMDDIVHLPLSVR